MGRAEPGPLPVQAQARARCRPRPRRSGSRRGAVTVRRRAAASTTLRPTFGAVHVAAGGVLEQTPDHVAGALHFDMPTRRLPVAARQRADALLPALQGTRMRRRLRRARPLRVRHALARRSRARLRRPGPVPRRRGARRTRPRALQAAVRPPHLPARRVRSPSETTGPGTANWTSLDEISPYMQVAVLTTEDGGFPQAPRLQPCRDPASIIANLKARRFVRGASTITMQLAKNLFLVARQDALAQARGGRADRLPRADLLEGRAHGALPERRSSSAPPCTASRRPRSTTSAGRPRS